MEEKIYTIPLLRAKMAPRTKRAKKAIRLVREFLKKHTKAEVIKIDKSINEAIWARGLRKVPSKIRVKAVKVEEEVWAYAPEAEVEMKEREEKKEVEEVAEEIEEKPPEEVETTEGETEEVAEEIEEGEEKVEPEKEEEEIESAPEQSEETTEEAKEIKEEEKES